MLNNLLGSSHDHHSKTNLPTSTAEWRQLRTHLDAVEKQPQCVCFNCGMLIYRKNATFLVHPPAIHRATAHA